MYLTELTSVFHKAENKTMMLLRCDGITGSDGKHADQCASEFF